MRFLTAHKIHNGYSFLPANSVLVLDADERVLDVKLRDEIDENKIEFFEGILCPGFVNTHCHLELSYLKNKLKEGIGLHEFIKDVELQKKPLDADVEQAIFRADEEMFNSGVVAVGDICNTAASFKLKSVSKIRYHNFLEVYAFDSDKAQIAFERGLNLINELKVLGLTNYSITPHAPYSASVNLLKKISDFAWNNNSILSLHNQESEDENLLFLNKSGKILDRLHHFNINTSNWYPTGKNSLPSVLIFLPKNLPILLVHNTFSTQQDIEFALDYSKNIFWCLCVNANLFIENKLPPVEALKSNNCKITLGTDSYASNWSLSIVDEINCINKKLPAIELESILCWATHNGARYLGMQDDLGSFEKGKKPGVVLIDTSQKKLSAKRVV